MPELLHEPPSQTEGPGKAGCPLHPQPRVQCVGSTRVSSPQVHRNTRPSLRNGFNGFLRALPGDRACLPPSSRGTNPAKLDASVGASGPHDFAVRVSIIRPARCCAPDAAASTASRTYVRDDHDTPLCVGRDGRVLEVIWVGGEAKYFSRRGWTAK